MAPNMCGYSICTMAPNMCGYSICNLLGVTILAPRIFRWLLDFWKMCVPLTQILCMEEVSKYYRRWYVLSTLNFYRPNTWR